MKNETHDFNDEIIFGSFYVNDDISIIDERLGFFNDKKGRKVDISIKEAFGNSPHIHLRTQSKDICRIKLRENEYQRDAYEKNEFYRLSKDEEHAFNRYMHAISKDSNNNNWYRILFEWNRRWRYANPGKISGIVDLSKGCPDYINIKEPK